MPLTFSSVHWKSRSTGLCALQFSLTLSPSFRGEEGSICTRTPSMSGGDTESRAAGAGGPGRPAATAPHPPCPPRPPGALQLTTSSTSFSICVMSSRSRIWQRYSPLLLLLTPCRLSTPLLVSAREETSCQSSGCGQGSAQPSAPCSRGARDEAQASQELPTGARTSSRPQMPHRFLVEAEDGRRVAISLAHQLHVVPLLHQRGGGHDVQLHVLRGVWGTRERAGWVLVSPLRP